MQDALNLVTYDQSYSNKFVCFVYFHGEQSDI